MSTEHHGFVFSVTFLLVFSGLIISIPVGLLGVGGTADEPSPVDPDLVGDFADSETFVKSNYTGQFYEYTMNAIDWITSKNGAAVAISRKLKVAGVLWLGAVRVAEFILPNGTSRGTTLTRPEIAGDADNGEVRYDLSYLSNGNDAGSCVVYWNETLYSDPEDAWDNNVLYFVHGIGFGSSAAANIGGLLIGILFLQLPDVPVLVNLLLASPLWASVIFIIWFIIKETTPFL